MTPGIPHQPWRCIPSSSVPGLGPSNGIKVRGLFAATGVTGAKPRRDAFYPGPIFGLLAPGRQGVFGEHDWGWDPGPPLLFASEDQKTMLDIGRCAATHQWLGTLNDTTVTETSHLSQSLRLARNFITGRHDMWQTHTNLSFLGLG